MNFYQRTKMLLYYEIKHTNMYFIEYENLALGEHENDDIDNIIGVDEIFKRSIINELNRIREQYSNDLKYSYISKRYALQKFSPTRTLKYLQKYMQLLDSEESTELNINDFIKEIENESVYSLLIIFGKISLIPKYILEKRHKDLTSYKRKDNRLVKLIKEFNEITHTCECYKTAEKVRKISNAFKHRSSFIGIKDYEEHNTSFPEKYDICKPEIKLYINDINLFILSLIESIEQRNNLLEQ